MKLVVQVWTDDDGEMLDEGTIEDVQDYDLDKPIPRASLVNDIKALLDVAHKRDVSDD